MRPTATPTASLPLLWPHPRPGLRPRPQLAPGCSHAYSRTHGCSHPAWTFLLTAASSQVAATKFLRNDSQETDNFEGNLVPACFGCHQDQLSKLRFIGSWALCAVIWDQLPLSQRPAMRNWHCFIPQRGIWEGIQCTVALHVYLCPIKLNFPFRLFVPGILPRPGCARASSTCKPCHGPWKPSISIWTSRPAPPSST